MSTDTNDEQQSAAAPRRRFLQSAGLAVGGFGLIAAVGPGALAAPKHRHVVHANGDIAVLQSALALEHEGIATYTIAGGSGLLTPDVLKIALVFLGHHKGHRDALADLVRKAGAKPVEPKTDAEYTSELNLGALKSQGDVVALATKLEMGAANAYVGQIAALHDHQLAHLFGQLSADEAVHWAILNNAAGAPAPTPPFIFG